MPAIAGLGHGRADKPEAQSCAKADLTNNQILVGREPVEQAGAFEVDVAGFVDAIVLEVPVAVVGIHDPVAVDHQPGRFNL